MFSLTRNSFYFIKKDCHQDGKSELISLGEQFILIPLQNNNRWSLLNQTSQTFHHLPQEECNLCI